MRSSHLRPPVAAALVRFRCALGDRFGDRLREVVLFGSQARADARPDSDVDVLVIVDGLTEAERREVFDLAWDADAVADELVLLAPIPYSAEQAADLRRRERRFLLDADREGIRL